MKEISSPELKCRGVKLEKQAKHLIVEKCSEGCILKEKRLCEAHLLTKTLEIKLTLVKFSGTIQNFVENW
jgi:hypothetical protein